MHVAIAMYIGTVVPIKYTGHMASHELLLTANEAHERFPGLSRRTAHRRIADGVQRVQQGRPEPGDNLITIVGNTHGAPERWWTSNLRRHPLRRPGRPPEGPIRSALDN